VVDGSETVEQAGERIFRLVLETASGSKSKSELLGFGDDEFAPWVVGATM
jgi:altronate dehydratase